VFVDDVLDVVEVRVCSLPWMVERSSIAREERHARGGPSSRWRGPKTLK
jgi:hypothetical protein